MPIVTNLNIIIEHSKELSSQFPNAPNCSSTTKLKVRHDYITSSKDWTRPPSEEAASEGCCFSPSSAPILQRPITAEIGWPETTEPPENSPPIEREFVRVLNTK